MNIKSCHFVAVIFGAWFAVTSPSAFSADNFTDAEWALLPLYCRDTQGNKGHTQANIAKWTAVMGDNFFHMHHYCRALVSFRRAERATLSPTEKKYLRERALDDFGYIVKASDSDFALLPEVFTWMGRLELLHRRPANADKAFARARTIKPDYWPAYYHWAEFLVTKNQKVEAMAIVKLGLQHSPNAKALHELFRSLGGKPGEIPPPIDKKPEVDIPATPSPAQPENPSITIPEAEVNN